MHSIIIQCVIDKTLAPKSSLLKKWAKQAIVKKFNAAEVTIRIVNITEMTLLNSKYRQKNSPTNVLSFPFSLPEGIELDIPILGDIVICADVVNREAREQHKTITAHWAHMVIHGIFHLLGYDHETDEDAYTMEALEIETMHTLGFENPYETGETP
jgi:probable rRNA maturation factor